MRVRTFQSRQSWSFGICAKPGFKASPFFMNPPLNTRIHAVALGATVQAVIALLSQQTASLILRQVVQERDFMG